MSEEAQKDKRPLLRSELDLQLLTTDSAWGKNEVGADFRKKTTKTYGYYTPRLNEDGSLMMGEDGKPIMELVSDEEVMWGMLGFFTRDFRLGNLNSWDGELAYCDYYTQLASDFLNEGMKKPFIICLSRVATKLELSQSKGGFFRRKSNTFTQEHINIDNEPKKVNLFGKGRGGE